MDKVTPVSNKLVLRYTTLMMEKLADTSRTLQRWRGLNAACLALVCLLLFGGAGIALHLVPAARLFSAWYDGMPSGGTPEVNAVSVRATEKQQVVLDDGSTVVMNAGSELSFGGDFNTHTREVRLRGEALFDVQDDPSRPFRVKASHMTVAGTAFGVKAQGDSLLISAIGGVVQVADSTGGYFEVRPNYEVMINTVSLEHRQRKLDPAQDMFWESEYLMLGEVTFGEAMRRIGRKFDVKIEVGNGALRDCVIHTEIHPGEDLGAIVDVLCKTVNARAVRRRDGIRVVGGSCR